MDSIVKIDNLTFRYKDNFIFDKFSLDIKKGEWVTITGPNGSGKSTLIKIITGITFVSDNEIYICNIKMNKDNIYDIRKSIGVVFDNIDNMFLCETVYDDIAFTLMNLGYKDNEIRKKVNEISRMLNIKDLLNKSSNQLSGGEKCKVAICSALIHDPKILILDESLSMIDEKSVKEIINILKMLIDEGITIINITHNLSESYYCDRLIVLNNGEILLDGHPLKVMEFDRVLNKIGIEVPFEVELSIKLKLYGLIDKIIPDIESLINVLWE